MASYGINHVNQIVAVGSVDGILTTAALMSRIGHKPVQFCQAFTVDKIDVSAWEPDRLVAFVDLAVNNRDPQMTRDFVQRVKDAGHRIIAIIDEHSREDWFSILYSFDDLVIEPQSQQDGFFKSSGAVLLEAIEFADGHMVELCQAADAADDGNFDTRLGSIVNSAVKSAIQDDSRRVYLANHLAFNDEPDSLIQSWIDEYAAIVAAQEEMIAYRIQSNNFVRVDAIGKPIDMTSLMFALYQFAPIALVVGEFYDKSLGRKIVQVAFGTNRKDLDLLACLDRAGVTNRGGFASKVNVLLEHEAAAIAAIQSLL